MRLTFIILTAVLALALPSAALAQGSGYGPGGGVLGEQNSGGGSSHTPSGGNAGQQAAEQPAAAPVPAEHGASGQLPFTGSDLLVVAGIGLVLLGAGVGLRRLRDNP